jgi:E3 SUMO-protein ligase PIAS1
MNENAPNFTCPVCHKAFDWDSLIIDGYFDNILKNSPPEVETVEVDPATWEWKIRTEDADLGDDSDSDDEGYGVKKEESQPGKVEVVELDDDGPAPTTTAATQAPAAPRPVHHQAAPSAPAANRRPPPQSSVIDLTLDSDDEEPAAPSRPAAPLAHPPPVTAPGSSFNFAAGNPALSSAAASTAAGSHSAATRQFLENVAAGRATGEAGGAVGGSTQPLFGRPTAPMANGPLLNPAAQQDSYLTAAPNQFSDNLPSDFENALFSMPMPEQGDIVGGGRDTPAGDPEAEDLNALLHRIRETFENNEDYDPWA